MQKFCDTHTIAFLKSWDNSLKPLDLSLSDYFRSHKSLGSHDRKTIGEYVYALVRWQSLFEELDPSKNFSKRLHLLQQRPISEWTSIQTLSQPARLGLSPYLWNVLTENYGTETARLIADVFNAPGPVFVRANLLKTTREELLRLWNGKFSIRPSTRTAAAIVFAKREPLFALPEFKEGLFEVQDEGSQLIADLIDVKPGDRVLDYCGGSGGKTLAFAPRMKGKGEIYLHDIRKSALTEASRRFRRAGVQNVQIFSPEHPSLPKLAHKMDWVLVDVPCSGTGTLRRNPDMKWKIDEAMIVRLKEEQRTIFEKAFRFVKPGGRIVYATCSILPEENEDQVKYFLSKFPMTLEKEPLKLLPEADGPDGFYAAVFIKSKIE
jgi:16S rRNA C967 or C1407 C5-methylase (RsmB/RsmF family)